jgi:Uma2 family endonuclease
MDVLISNPAFLRRLIRKRRATGADRFDEVWDGVYIVSPGAGDEHQKIGGKLYIALDATIESPGLGEVRQIPNLSDRQKGWRQNYRCPDVAVFLKGTSAICKGAYWLGGPDFAVEVISPYDRSRKKLDFYAKIGVKELLLVDRKPWALELYRLQAGRLVLVGKSDLDHPDVLASEVVPLSFQLVANDPRPRIEIAHADGVQRWSA